MNDYVIHELKTKFAAIAFLFVAMFVSCLFVSLIKRANVKKQKSAKARASQNKIPPEKYSSPYLRARPCKGRLLHVCFSLARRLRGGPGTRVTLYLNRPSERYLAYSVSAVRGLTICLPNLMR